MTKYSGTNGILAYLADLYTYAYDIFLAFQMAGYEDYPCVPGYNIRLIEWYCRKHSLNTIGFAERGKVPLDAMRSIVIYQQKNVSPYLAMYTDDYFLDTKDVEMERIIGVIMLPGNKPTIDTH